LARAALSIPDGLAVADAARQGPNKPAHMNFLNQALTFFSPIRRTLILER